MKSVVRSDKRDNSIKSDGNNNDNKDEERMMGGGDTLPTTLTHSPTLSQTPSLTIIKQGSPLDVKLIISGNNSDVSHSKF